MAFFQDLTDFGHVLEHQCHNFEDTLMSRFAFAYNFWPIIVGAVFIGVFIARKEIFYTIMATAFTVDALVNWGLRAAIAQDGPESVCIPGNEMPAYAADGITFLGISFLVSSTCVYRVPLRNFTITMIMIGGPLALYVRVWLHANTPAQMFAGAAFGTTWALIFMVILKRVFTYDFLRAWFLTYDSWITGSNYQDTVLRPDRPVVCVDSPISTMFLKVNSSTGMQYARTYEQFARAHAIRDYIEKHGNGDHSTADIAAGDEEFDAYRAVAATKTRMYYVKIT